MATNLFFNNFMASGEQKLIEDLAVEAIKQYGIDCYYVPRTVDTRDPLLREATVASFDTAIDIEAYIVDVQGFTGDGKFLSKFGLEIRDEMTFAISMRSFNDEVGSITAQIRPNEGDLIYLPLNGKCFSVKFVDHEYVFYQIGSLQWYTIICEVFEYNNEVFATGVDVIDLKYNKNDTKMEDQEVTTEDGYVITDEQGNDLVPADFAPDVIDGDSQNKIIQDQANKVLDWNDSNPFGESQY